MAQIQKTLPCAVQNEGRGLAEHDERDPSLVMKKRASWLVDSSSLYGIESQRPVNIPPKKILFCFLFFVACKEKVRLAGHDQQNLKFWYDEAGELALLHFFFFCAMQRKVRLARQMNRITTLDWL